MERWAANTLRTIGIILTGGFVLVTSLLLVLLSMCAAQGGFEGGKHPEQVVPYAVAAVMVAILGCALIARLGRDIVRSSRLAVSPAATGTTGTAFDTAAAPEAGASPTLAPSAPSVPLHLSLLGRIAVERLVFAVGGQIALSAIAWFLNQLHFWSAPRAFAPHNWVLVLLPSFVLYHVPYAILIYALLKHPDRRALTYSIAIPAVLLLQTLFSLSVIGFYYVHHPLGIVLLIVPWAMHIVILIMAYKAIQQIGIHPQPASLIIAAVALFFYFSIIHVVTPMLYRFAR